MNIKDLLNKPTPSVDALAVKYNVSSAVVQQQLDQGSTVELEHTDDPQVAEEIALDHLAEDLYYYQKLKRMETGASESLRESTTRTTRQGAPGTLSAKITKLYGGSVTCDKARKLKQRRSATAHDKSQANWFINMHDCDSELSEMLTTSPSTPIAWTRTEDSWVTKFPFDDHTVEIEIADLDAHSQGLWVEFSVDGSQHITGKLGARSAQLLSWVVHAVHKFLQTHTHWTHVVFSGDRDEPSRNKLYAAIVARLAKNIVGVRAQQNGYKFKLIKTQPISELFNLPAINTPWRRYRDFWETNFAFDGHNVVVEMVSDTGGIRASHVFDNRDIALPEHSQGYEVIFRVDQKTDVTGALGHRAAQLLARVISVIQGFLQTHAWDYVVFTGESGSRDKLYAAMAHVLSEKNHARTARYGSDFVIYKTMPVMEMFDYKLERHAWSVREQGQSYVTVDFEVEDQPYEMDVMAVRGHPGVYDVVFGHRDSTDPIGITGTGGASRVFAAVAQLLTWAIKKMNIQGIYFTAAEPSRKKLYAALSREFARKLGWQLTVDASKMPYAPGAREQGYFVHMPSVQEAAGVGLVVPGVNQPAGIHKDEIRRQAAKLGFDVTAQGVPPTARTNGKIP